MSKRIEIDGRFYRERRGKLVEIPAEWVGKITTEQTIRNRPSKLINKRKRDGWHGSHSKMWACTEFKDKRDLPIED